MANKNLYIRFGKELHTDLSKICNAMKLTISTVSNFTKVILNEDNPICAKARKGKGKRGHKMIIKKIKGLYGNGLQKIEGADNVFYSINHPVDYYEVEELKRCGGILKGNELSFFFYPECRVYTPFQQEKGLYYDERCVAYFENSLYFTRSNFNTDEFILYEYSKQEDTLKEITSLDISTIKLYNISICFSPLMICAENIDVAEKNLAFYYPEKFSMNMDSREVFDFRDSDKFYFSKWVEEGLDENKNMTPDYEYYEMYVIKDKNGTVLEEARGSIKKMADGNYVIT